MSEIELGEKDLPPIADVFNGPGEGNYKSLYGTYILPAEEAAVNAQDREHTIAARIVGYLLLFPPGPMARAALQQSISSCFDQEDGSDYAGRTRLYDLGRYYLDNFIRIFKKYNGEYTSSYNFPEPSLEHAIDDLRVEAAVRQPPSSCGSAKQQALVRDGFRCMVTGRIALCVYEKYRLEAIYPNAVVDLLECCHIFPSSINNINSIVRLEKTAAATWAILESFGYELTQELDGKQIHRLENILTLSTPLHGEFDKLNLWFEEVQSEDNTYIPTYYKNTMRRALLLPDKVTFHTHDTAVLQITGLTIPPDLPLPNPRYLRIHAACCKIAHLSGAVEYLNEIYRDMDELGVLAADGSSGNVLATALLDVMH